MKFIKLTNGQKVIVDDKDYKMLSQHNWWLHGEGYAYRQVCSGRSKDSRGSVRSIMMHRVIMKTPDSMDTDHINRNKLDNRRSNLRIVTRTQNNYNTGLRCNNTSGYRGVSFTKRLNRWRAYIGGSKGRIELGHFASKQQAVEARLQAEKAIIQ